MDDELLKVFVTMQADPDMKMRAWAHAIEELLAMVGHAVTESDWKDTTVYGPDSGAFSFFPNICIEAKLPAQVVINLQEAILANPWLSAPVSVTVAQKVMH